MSFPLFFDEQVDPRLAALLRRAGYDVLTTQEAGRASQSLSDDDQLVFAVAQGRVLFTHDRDFFSIAERWREAGREHFGIVFSPPRHRNDLSVGLMTLLELHVDGIADLILWLPSTGQTP